MLEFRKIKPEEYELMREQLINVFRVGDFETFITPFKIIVVVGRWKEVLLVTKPVLDIFQEFKVNRNPYFMGIHFGELKKDKFKLSLEGITLIADLVDEKTKLSEAGEKKVLYGRDLQKKELVHIPSGIKKRDFSILTNENGEALALGKFLFSSEEIRTLNENDRIVKNVIDKGWYLRKGK